MDHLIIFNERHLPRLLAEYVAHYTAARSHRSSHGRVVAGIVDGIRGLYPQLRAVRSQMDEITAHFDGEDVLIPYMRSALDGAEANLLELKAEVEPLAGEVALPEPADVMRGDVRTIFERELDG